MMTQNIDGINFISLRKNKMYFVAMTRSNESPFLFLELLERITVVCTGNVDEKRYGGSASISMHYLDNMHVIDRRSRITAVY